MKGNRKGLPLRTTFFHQHRNGRAAGTLDHKRMLPNKGAFQKAGFFCNFAIARKT
jgi:hypothetical protein